MNNLIISAKLRADDDDQYAWDNAGDGTRRKTGVRRETATARQTWLLQVRILVPPNSVKTLW